MAKTHAQLSETHLLGPQTRQWVVRARTADTRGWLQDAPVCSTLAQHQIAHLGVCHAVAPFRIVRTKQSGTYFLACFGGRGRVLVEGRWQVCGAGTACLLPPHILNAFYAEPGAPWEFIWVRYEQPTEQRPIAGASSPVLAKFDPEPLRHAALGLHHEARGGAVPPELQHWTDLIHAYVLRFARPWQVEDRLWLVWESVAAHLDEEWTLERLARLAHMSTEHMRRLCRRQLGRSPMHQVIFLRMRRAAELLSTTNDKVETIATAVGYHNPFGFSNAFKKWTGWRPSEFPSRLKEE
ncbi:MAG: AraC family transcriptional regulator [Pedosphaera sp.]|nr:AraC family transcriptional regulator [Pedosphaera sp.]PHX92735.1 MAG: AraC family transcriptional regulator [Pedosphaera sp.]